MNEIEQCPADRDVASWLWEHNKPVLDELRAIVEPLAEELSTHVESEIVKTGDVVSETLTTYVQHDIPFGVPYTLLPPRLFSGLEDGTEAPQLPQDEAEARQLIGAYSERCLEPPLAGMPEGSYTAPAEERMGHILDDLLWMAKRGTVIDPVRWERYRQVAREQAQQGRYDLDMISISRGNSIKSMYGYPPLVQLAFTQATGAFDRFATMPTAALDADGPSHGLLPAGFPYFSDHRR